MNTERCHVCRGRSSDPHMCRGLSSRRLYATYVKFVHTEGCRLAPKGTYHRHCRSFGPDHPRRSENGYVLESVHLAFAFVLFVFWGVALRGNPAAHKRVMILSTVAILDPGYGRLTGWLWPEPQSMLMWYFFSFWADLLVLRRWLPGTHGAAV